jgi:hypothetical protein
LPLTDAINQATENFIANDIIMTLYLKKKSDEVYHMLDYQLYIDDALEVRETKVFRAIDYLPKGRSIAETATLTSLSEDKVKTLNDNLRK